MSRSNDRCSVAESAPQEGDVMAVKKKLSIERLASPQSQQDAMDVLAQLVKHSPKAADSVSDSDSASEASTCGDVKPRFDNDASSNVSDDWFNASAGSAASTAEPVPPLGRLFHASRSSRGAVLESAASDGAPELATTDSEAASSSKLPAATQCQRKPKKCTRHQRDESSGLIARHRDPTRASSVPSDHRVAAENDFLSGWMWHQLNLFCCRSR
eukprot:gnl/TRDRNA2_/TRDRNA2_202548_c0_seq1.p1 gnl/TRDRNA2_/TRDRNA2_202548_c0~~gnl/TRDRNA2_/TRDRNA2_202548_c0_seq1.p1  ORF type:complete len:214 (-),score=40.29 gnl/TRDRNA2_/TRDRNA2_202548_c0_seq1:127-768(-)